MNCLEFRNAVGAEPGLDTPDIAAHRDVCPACAAFQQRMRGLDRLVGRALQVDFPSPRSATRPSAAAASSGPGRRGWLALAASMLLGVAIGAGLWLSYPRDSIAAEAMGHIRHEPQALVDTQPVPPQEVSNMLLAFGLRLKSDADPVSYSSRCYWQGHWVPHLVVRTAGGPVTVFVLPHRHVEAEERFESDGYSGVVLPAPAGSIAVIGRDVPGLPLVAQQVFQAIDWTVTEGQAP